jgi:copper(I)-binding protein
VNPFERRTRAHGRSVPALAACGVAATFLLSACSAGQVAQTATQEPAINGVSALLGPIALRNIHLYAVQTTDYVQEGQDVELVFVAANASPDVADELVSITSDVGTVTLSGDTAVPVSGSLKVGKPDGELAALENVEPVDTAQATVALSEPITNGLTYDFTFTFEKAGETTVGVPISAGEAPRRDHPVESGHSGGSSGGGH